MSTQITAFGAVSGASTGPVAIVAYANHSVACSTTTSGAPMTGMSSDAAIYIMQYQVGTLYHYFLAVTGTGLISSVYIQGGTLPETHGLVAGQSIYLPAQAASPAIGGIGAFTAGYYDISAVAIGGPFYGLAIGGGLVSETLAQPTACPEAWTAESTPDEPQYSADFTINKYDNMSVQYKRQVEQIPFSKGSNTAANLRKRSSAYKVTKGVGKKV